MTKQKRVALVAAVAIVALAVLSTAMYNRGTSRSPELKQQGTNKNTAVGNENQSSKSTATALPANLNSAVATAVADQLGDYTATSGNFTVDYTASPAAGWIVANITPRDGADPGRVILKSNGANKPLTLVAGPTTQFAHSELEAFGVPSSVQKFVGVRSE